MFLLGRVESTVDTYGDQDQDFDHDNYLLTVNCQMLTAKC
jgi:hypothetical protein